MAIDEFNEAKQDEVARPKSRETRFQHRQAARKSQVAQEAPDQDPVPIAREIGSSDTRSGEFHVTKETRLRTRLSRCQSYRDLLGDIFNQYLDNDRIVSEIEAWEADVLEKKRASSKAYKEEQGKRENLRNDRQKYQQHFLDLRTQTGQPSSSIPDGIPKEALRPRPMA